MSQLTGQARSGYVRHMFGRIAVRYDLLNRLMTLGQDVRWRREAVRRLRPSAGGCVLDVGAGTGDLAFEIRRQYPGVTAVAADFTIEMIDVGRSRSTGQDIEWVLADALHLPFADACFAGVVSGFLLRNLGDMNRSLSEQKRVLLPGSWLVSLDTTPPPAGILGLLVRFHLHTMIPLLGRVFAGEAEAYRYLPDSTEHFAEAETLARTLQSMGMTDVGFVRRMLRTVAIHWARKGETG